MTDPFALVAGVFGLLVGSFLNVCIARIPEDRSVMWPPSHCPSCGHGIRPWDNIPVLSWALLRGRCRDCRAPISSLYPTIELLTGALAWLLWRRIVPEGIPGAVDLAAYGVAFGFTCAMIAITYIDIRHYIIPDRFSILAAPVGIAASAWLEWLGHPAAIGWRQSALGALFGGGFILAISALYWLVRRRPAMGWGDIKLLTMIGSFLGALPALPFVLMASCGAGALFGLPYAVLTRRGRTAALPFGPFLALAGVAWLLQGPELMERTFPGILLLSAQINPQ